MSRFDRDIRGLSLTNKFCKFWKKIDANKKGHKSTSFQKYIAVDPEDQDPKPRVKKG